MRIFQGEKGSEARRTLAANKEVKRMGEDNQRRHHPPESLGSRGTSLPGIPKSRKPDKGAVGHCQFVEQQQVLKS